MGQYWYVVNLTKREFIHPHKLGTGLKLWEQLANHPGTGAALIILTAAMPEPRGGGDLDLEGSKGDEYSQIAKRTIGRWAGDRIAIVGDYAKRRDLPMDDEADLIYSLCDDAKSVKEQIAHLRTVSKRKSEYGMLSPELALHYESMAKRLEQALKEKRLFKDISDDVCRVIEHEMGGKYEGDGWREFVRPGEKHDTPIAPDMVIAASRKE